MCSKQDVTGHARQAVAIPEYWKGLNSHYYSQLVPKYLCTFSFSVSSVWQEVLKNQTACPSALGIFISYFGVSHRNSVVCVSWRERRDTAWLTFTWSSPLEKTFFDKSSTWGKKGLRKDLSIVINTWLLFTSLGISHKFNASVCAYLQLDLVHTEALFWCLVGIIYRE